jgi:hypothetical protein
MMRFKDVLLHGQTVFLLEIRNLATIFPVNVRPIPIKNYLSILLAMDIVLGFVPQPNITIYGLTEYSLLDKC